ncbi:CopG family transcriptional regulator [Methylobacterium mesophilicum SR1.6/6]|uniref:CopG family transcriptional regulator n=1 Tax=Methylobacterium mesophilicum SR1.6/6 TaxID=908290 RepID=A0A6B9FQT4_9HYPH|nr:CopG family transcriptional regulator [Methylobacterium mesophilicum SR1.6/6]
MSTDVARKKSKMGRPSVDSEEVRSRMQRPLLDAVDAWSDQQPDKPPRAEAVRQILAEHLKAKGYLK